MSVDKHIYFSYEENARILDYCSKNKLSFSKAVCRLVDIALDNIEILDRLDNMQSDIISSIKEQKIIFALLKQLYSDLDFENITDPKKSKSVNEFMKKLKGDKFND